MKTEVVLPPLGMGMQEGMVVRWLKEEGAHVEAGEAVVEIEADKVTEVVVAPVSGVLAGILVAEGETVSVRQALAVISGHTEPAGEATPAPAPAAPPPARPAQDVPGRTSVPADVQTRVVVSPVARHVAQQLGVDLNQVQGTGPGGRITDEDVRRAAVASARPAPASIAAEPRARRLAQEQGIDLGQIAGSGPGGRITADDVRRKVEVTSRPALRGIPLAGVRATIAKRMQSSLQTMAQLTLTTEADVTDLVALRATLKEQHDVTYTDLVTKAAALALQAHPRLNARLEGEEIRLLPEVHIGVAVALEDGLIVPVVRNASRKSLREISQETARLVRNAREGNLRPDEVTGSTFTITNLGMYEIDAFTPIINPPEVAILGVGRIVEKLARASEGIVWRQIMTLSLTFDHRLIDGAPAAAFLQAIKRQLESPSSLAA